MHEKPKPRGPDLLKAPEEKWKPLNDEEPDRITPLLHGTARNQVSDENRRARQIPLRLVDQALHLLNNLQLTL